MQPEEGKRRKRHKEGAILFACTRGRHVLARGLAGVGLKMQRVSRSSHQSSLREGHVAANEVRAAVGMGRSVEGRA